jgi:glycosyltransferase involved in cell wall biosynthesis
VLISSKTHVNVVALVACTLYGGPSFHIIRECSRYQFDRVDCSRDRIYLALAAALYGRADAIVAVSRDVAEACSSWTGIDVSRITTIPDPIVTPSLRVRVKEPADHPWLQIRSPVFLGAGRLVPEKDFGSLLRAFDLVRRRVPSAGLIILGEGPERAVLERSIERLRLAEGVSLPGFVRNPLPYMRRASVFVLSSRSEGFPGVVIESLYAGCPVVATRCSNAVVEVLDGGELGALVRVGDHEAMASAMLELVAQPPDSQRLRQRAEEYSVGRIVGRYQELLPVGAAR